MATSGIKLNSATIKEMLDGGLGVEAALDEAADRVAQAARESAPVLSGNYQANIVVETDHETDRIAKRVLADVPYAMKIEARTGNLLGALDAAG